ncbi:hypothetical protein AYI68_g4537 [Smittium mucronatum]|uniref:Uncharacterized protein n=1 Tax=Smittium mucronatum TaxID=133383 RepID=A0A1R0GWT3_9FUNG|nr:hypothetical protein AYI68_g4537 [Smittium mucronatum]
MLFVSIFLTLMLSVFSQGNTYNANSLVNSFLNSNFLFGANKGIEMSCHKNGYDVKARIFCIDNGTGTTDFFPFIQSVVANTTDNSCSTQVHVYSESPLMTIQCVTSTIYQPADGNDFCSPPFILRQDPGCF